MKMHQSGEKGIGLSRSPFFLFGLRERLKRVRRLKPQLRKPRPPPRTQANEGLLSPASAGFVRIAATLVAKATGGLLKHTLKRFAEKIQPFNHAPRLCLGHKLTARSQSQGGVDWLEIRFRRLWVNHFLAKYQGLREVETLDSPYQSLVSL